MKKSTKAFTLIELLVVITIIGILATGAVAVYTSQIQKGRDATRISSLESLRGGIEQYYQDDSEYPKKTEFMGVRTYVPVLPIDPKTGQASNNTSFEYAYNVGPDSNGIVNQIYEASCGFENAGNQKNKAATEGGDDEYRLEIGIISSGSTSLSTKLSGSLKNLKEWAKSGDVNVSCVTEDNPNGGVECGDASNSNTGTILVIR